MDDALPLQDYDQLSGKNLEHRIRSLDESQLRTLLEYERAHADRLWAKMLLENRIRQLAEGGTPTPGGDGPPMESAQAPEGGSPVSPATSPEPQHGPPHGTPQQPGKGPRMGS
jgi:hypothetical protein